MKSGLWLENQRRGVRLDLRFLKEILAGLLQGELGRDEYELGFFFVGVARITELNETYLQHAGPTDIITFDYTDPARPDLLAGDISICLDEVQAQARRYRVPWPTELVRCCVHGVLHLKGYDDLKPAKRRIMKREENRLLKRLLRRFNFTKLEKGK